MSLIAVRDLTVRYGGHTVLSHVDMAIDRGEIVTIVGPNGSGKSTLLRAIIGAVPLAGGQVSRASGLTLGYVPQKLAIDPTLPMTVARFMSLPRRQSAADVTAALEQAGVPDLRERQMTDLSGGQFQRILLARALLSRPDLLLLDEATQGLDQPGSAAFYRQIEEVRRRLGCAVLMVSHELHVVMSASDRVICLNGHVCCQGTPDIVASAPEYRALFGSGTQGALALYRHDHNHSHDEGCDHGHAHDHPHDRGNPHGYPHDHGQAQDHLHPHDHAQDHAQGTRSPAARISPAPQPKGDKVH
jgi:zinc transport system ATP-binding protein